MFNLYRGGFMKLSQKNKFLSMALTLAVTPSLFAQTSQVAIDLKARLAQPLLMVGGVTLDKAMLTRFYTARSFTPLMLESNQASYRFYINEVIDILRRHPSSRGLTPSRYWSASYDQQIGFNDYNSLLNNELLITNAYLSMARDLTTGQVLDPTAVGNSIEFAKKPATAGIALAAQILENPQSLGAFSATEALTKLDPQHPDYIRLVSLLSRLREFERTNAWFLVPNNGTIRPGQTHRDIPFVRARLMQMGYSLSNTNSTVYDAELQKQMVDFQKNSQLGSDGVIGSGTRARLNVPLARLISSTRVSLERWRWLPLSLNNPVVARNPTLRVDRYLLVNIAHQELAVNESGNWILKMPVVAGRPDLRTPSRQDSFGRIILNPNWTPTDGIETRTIIPNAQKNPNYFFEAKLKVFDERSNTEVDPAFIDWNSDPSSLSKTYLFRQMPGPHNSLGEVKFDFMSGRGAYYLHSTSAATKGLFYEPARLKSSGCVRVEKPLELAEYLFARNGVRTTNLKAGGKFFGSLPELQFIAANSEIYQIEEIQMARTMYIYMIYQTVTFDDSGRLKYVNDTTIQPVSKDAYPTGGYEQDAAIAAAAGF